jgi:2'-5' RNA ligase
MTLLGPFPTEDRLPLEDLHDLFASVDPFRLRFAELRSFPGVLWLAPEPARPVVALVGVLAQRWPQARRHGETFDLDEVVPHVTVAMRDDEQTRREFEDVLADLLPLEVAVTEAWFVEQDGERRWQRRETFRLGAPAT